MAPEFGVCRDLGANLFNCYVVPGTADDINAIFATLIREIARSRMQYLFEHSIGLAIANTDIIVSPDTETRDLKDKLLIKQGELYQVLDGMGEIVARPEFYTELPDSSIDSEFEAD